MSTALLTRLAAGPLFALLTASVYRTTLWTLGGMPSDGHVQWGLALSVLACAVAWSHAFRQPSPSALEVELATLRAAGDEALAALSDPDMAWTPAGVDARQALRLALGYPIAPVCTRCNVDQGGHSSGCAGAPAYIRTSVEKGGVA